MSTLMAAALVANDRNACACGWGDTLAVPAHRSRAVWQPHRLVNMCYASRRVRRGPGIPDQTFVAGSVSAMSQPR
jgi:hypothetical protein